MANYTILNGELIVGGAAPDASAAVDVTSTTKGFLPPRMTTGQRDAISSPATGLIVNNTTTNLLERYDGSAWVIVGGLGSLNGETGAVQTFSAGTAGTDFAISSSGGVHTFDLPTASGSARGALASADWTTFNSKIANVVEDTTPQLGGNLDANGFNIEGVTPTEMSYLSGVTSGIQAQFNAITSGYSRREKVIDKVDCTAVPPTEVSGDRYILDFTVGTVNAAWDGAAKGDIVEFNGSTWVATTPVEGWVTYGDTNNKDYLYVDDGTPNWEERLVSSTSASGISITDSGAYYTGTDVEAALQEIGAGTTLDGRYLLESNNLSDLDNAGTARTNLGVAIGSDVQAYDATLAALAAYSTNGFLVQTAADTFAGRSIAGTASRVSVSNGDGVSGNPTIDIDAAYVGQSSITTLGTIGTGVWQGTAIADSYISSAATWNAKVDRAGDTMTGKLTIQQGTLGNEVFQMSSTATNDDPTEKVIQNRVATTDATVTTMHTFAIPATTTVALEIMVIARRTGGTAGTAEDGGRYKISGVFKNVAGTATLIGGLHRDIDEDQTSWDADLVISSGNVLLKVTGATDNNITWHMTSRVYSLTS